MKRSAISTCHRRFAPFLCIFTVVFYFVNLFGQHLDQNFQLLISFNTKLLLIYYTSATSSAHSLLLPGLQYCITYCL